MPYRHVHRRGGKDLYLDMCVDIFTDMITHSISIVIIVVVIDMATAGVGGAVVAIVCIVTVVVIVMVVPTPQVSVGSNILGRVIFFWQFSIACPDV